MRLGRGQRRPTRRPAALLAVAAALALAPAPTAAIAAPAPASSGIQVGPAPPPVTTTSTPTTTVPGDQASHAAFWDLPGRVREAIDDWFRGLVLDALTPTLDLVGKTVLSTPALGGNAQITGLWQVALVTADALLGLCLLVAAGLAMSHETMQTRYALKDLLGRLAFAAVAVNASLSLVDQLGSVANALAAAFLGDGASAAAASASFEQFVVSALAGGGIFLTLLGLACAVAAVSLLTLYL